MRTVSAFSLACVLAGGAWGHGSPYVVFTSRFLDASARPVSGLTAVLDMLPSRAGAPAARAEAPIRSGLARVTVAFPGDFHGAVRLRVVDGKRRPIGAPVDFAYAHRAGSGLEAAFAAGPRDREADALKDGEAGLGSDGRVTVRPALPGEAAAFRLEWTPEGIDAAEAEEAARGREADQGIDADIRARLEAIRRKRGKS